MKLFRTLVAGMALLASLSAHSLNIYCEDDKPLQFKNEDGSLTGLTIEVVQEIQKRIGNKDPIQMVPWARGLDAVDKEPDALLFSMSRTAERNPKYQWIGPVSETAFLLYAKAGSSVNAKNLEEAKKLKSIGVYREDVRDQFLTSAGFANLERTNDNTLNFKKLMADRIEAYASSNESIASDAQQAGFKLSDVKPLFVFLSTQLYIAASKQTNPATVAQWNKALDDMKKDGTFGKIHKKFYPHKDLPGPTITKF